MDPQELERITKDPLKARVFAIAYKNEGKYEQALDMHEWFHFNAVLIKPSLYGVRLSYALNDWIELGEIYPKAKERLVEIRDDEIKKIKNGVWRFQEFHDVREISRKLKDEEVSYEIFKSICEKETDKDKVNKCFDIMFDWLVNKSEKELCRQFMGDPLRRVKKYIESYKGSDSAVERLIKKEEVSCDGISPKIKEELLKAPNRSFFSDMRLLVKALKLLKLDKKIEEVYMAGKDIIPDEEYEQIFK